MAGWDTRLNCLCCNFLEPSAPNRYALDEAPPHDNCTVYVTSVPHPADELGHDLAMHLRAAYTHVRRSSNAVFSLFEMSSDQYVLLAVLAREGEATQQQLVKRCYSDTATIGTMLLLLEARGLVTRAPHPRDGRARSVKLTRSGRVLAEKMKRSSSKLRANLVALFDEPELRTLLAFLKRLASAMAPPQRRTTTVRPHSKRRRDARFISDSLPHQ